MEYPDRRIKPVVYMMASTGIRVGAWDYLKYGHITPIERDAKLVAAKVLVYAETPDSYVTFMTPEAYREVEAWMKFRKQCGEKYQMTAGSCVISGIQKQQLGKIWIQME